MVQEGEIWPNMTTQFFIVFKPEEAKLCEQTIYFDVTGQCACTQNNTHLDFAQQVVKSLSCFVSYLLRFGNAIKSACSFG